MVLPRPRQASRGLMAPRARTPAAAGPSGGSPGSRRPHGPANGSLGVCGGPGWTEGADGAAGRLARAPPRAAVPDAPGSRLGTENRTPIGPCGTAGTERPEEGDPERREGRGTRDQGWWLPNLVSVLKCRVVPLQRVALVVCELQLNK